ncbi:MAG TPA: GIY-YIG nuclease family protein [Gemmatimonadaceae bacterium]
MRSREYYVYILSSPSRALYTGVTNDLVKRLWQHRNGRGSTFAARYNVSLLVYFETTTDIYSAITREKQLKGWRREKKIRLIEQQNPDWHDLAIDWGINSSRPKP